jgi:hypothetical protein
MKTTKKEKDALRSFLKHHMYNLRFSSNLEDFEMLIVSSDDAECGKDKTDFDKGTVAMTMEVDYEYLRATLVYGNKHIMELWKSKDYEEILRYVCHEVGHIITGEPFDRLKIPYKKDGKYYQERLTERVGRLLGRLYDTYIDHNNIDLKTGRKRHAKRKKR